tara:strand:- start:7309 stop:8055 length:747 start_codon:yes stop_codon:yes gene_type:complete
MASIKFNKNASIGAALLSAVSLKLCCWGPLLLTGIAGVSGSSVYFSWLIVLKPYLLTIAFLSLGFAFYQVYKPKKEESCCSGNCKTEKKSFFKSKLYVWIVAAFVISMTLISYFPQFFYRIGEKEIIIIDNSSIESVKLNIEGMTCTGCEENINHSLNQLDGLVAVKTRFSKNYFIIIFQKTVSGSMRGGSSIKFNSSATIDVQIKDGERIAFMEKDVMVLLVGCIRLMRGGRLWRIDIILLNSLQQL